MLPILESLVNGPFKATRKTGYGRTPSVLVLLPTRELAKQVNTTLNLIILHSILGIVNLIKSMMGTH